MADASPATGDAAMLALLARLTRKGARLEALDDDGYLLRYPGERMRMSADQARSRRIEAVLAAEAVTRGWLQCEQNRALRLSEAGALALRRGAPPPGLATSQALPHLPPRIPLTPGRHGLARLTHLKDGRGDPVLTASQREAGERLARDFQAGRMQPRVTANWDRASLGLSMERQRATSADAISDSTAAAQERVRGALASAGPEFADILIDVCCLEIGLDMIGQRRAWPRGTARVVLGLALDRLIRHYGIVATGPARGRMQTWSAGAPEC